MPSETKFASTATGNTGAGDSDWSNPGNATASDGTFATVSLANSRETRELLLTNFGFTIPSGASINGIETHVNRRASRGGIQDAEHKLYNAAHVGDDKADTVTDWPTTATERTYGSDSDDWNAGLTVSDINSTDFGVLLRGANNSGASETLDVDYVSLTVYYTGPPDTPTNVSATALDYRRIRVAWDASAETDYYEVQRSDDGSTGWELIGTATDTELVNGSLDGATQYFYRVRACNDDGCSGWSTVVDATTDADPGLLIVGTREPQFTVRLFGTLGSAQSGVALDTITFAGSDVSFEFTTEIPGGFGGANVGGMIQQDNQLIPAYLPDPVTELPPFAHVEILAGMDVVWEGQATEPQLDSAGYPVGFQASGYWSALGDTEFESTDTTAVTSGEILRDARPTFLHLGTGEQFEPPQVEHAPADFDGMTYGQIWDAIVKEGDGLGNALDLMIWDNRVVWAHRRIPPQVAHYRVDLGDSGLELNEVPWSEAVGRVRTRYEDSVGDTQETEWFEASAFVGTFGRQREKTLEGGKLTAAQAAGVARVYLAQHSIRRYSGTLTLPDNHGLATLDGGMRPPWLIRAGEWVEVADIGMMVIHSTSYDSARRSATLQIGEQRRDWQRFLRRMQETTEAVRANINSTTGGKQ